MRKLYIFDLDGVLLDSSNIHYVALNQALEESGYPPISRRDHACRFNGLSTRAKLATLPGVDIETVFHRKQVLTQFAMKNVEESPRLQQALRGLKSAGSTVMCASNCIRNTVETVLENLGISDLFDAVFTNEDVESPKPSPEIYLKCMKAANVDPKDTLIFEDSYVGLSAAVASRAGVHYVKCPSDLTVDYVLSADENLTRNVNIVIPMAGNGSRFAKVGYKDPKPFIPVFGEPMISWVVRNLGVNAKYTFIIREEFEETYDARTYLNTIAPGCSIVTVDSLTEGAACTVLLAKERINNESPLIIINSDQYIEFEGHETAFKFIFDFLYDPKETGMDGKISTFDGERHPKWSYAKVADNGVVTEVREKDPFSDHATTGLYMWRRGSDFVTYAHQMIAKNIRVNNEFYVVPVFNEAIADDKKFIVCKCTRMWGIGVPEDLDIFLRDFVR